jgi:hypothetical protein
MHWLGLMHSDGHIPLDRLIIAMAFAAGTQNKKIIKERFS